MGQGLRYIREDEPGYGRRRCGKGFIYLDQRGKRLKSGRIISRIKSLVIPPAWRDVWICKDADGHLQATGTDQRGRRQYLYHPEWEKKRQDKKFRKLAEFGAVLPLIRQETERLLRKRDWTREKVIALVIRLMDENALRIGNERYRDENDTFGVTTLRRKHLEEEGAVLKLSFRAKSGKQREIRLEDRRLRRLVRECSELPGHELFRYRDENGRWQAVDSADVNRFLQQIAGKRFTAKDFRTWWGTAKAVGHYPAALRQQEENPRKNLITAVIRKVAEDLGNTLATCREYYIHDKVLSCLETGRIRKYIAEVGDMSEQTAYMSKPELVTLRVLNVKLYRQLLVSCGINFE